MEKEEIIRAAERLEGSAADYPFEGDFETVVFRHKQTRRWFGLVLKVPKRYLGEGARDEVCLNLKCPRDLSEILRQNYKGILPAYHMNKSHWITVRLHADVPQEEILRLWGLSYDLTGGKGGKVRG